MTLGDEFVTLLSAAQGGDEHAIAQIYRAFDPGLRTYLRARAPREADDLAAEVWLAVVRRIGSFTGDEAAFRAWLFTIARRQVVGQWRKDGRRRTDVTDMAGGTGASSADTEAEAIERATSDAAVAALIDGLSADQAEVILLRVVAGLEVAEVAEVLGKRAGTIRVIQHRALQRLRKLHESM